jgi:hypothetical protein
MQGPSRVEYKLSPRAGLVLQLGGPVPLRGKREVVRMPFARCESVNFGGTLCSHLDFTKEHLRKPRADLCSQALSCEGDVGSSILSRSAQALLDIKPILVHQHSGTKLVGLGGKDSVFNECQELFQALQHST